MKNMYQPNVQPQYPDCQGRQFAGDAATPDYLDVNYDAFNNEQAQDRPFHMDKLAGDAGRFGYNNPSKTSLSGAQSATGRQYADDFKGGYSSYGVPVDGSAPVVEKIMVDASRADRGKDS